MYLVTLAINRAWITAAGAPTGPAVICGTNQTTGTVSVMDGETRHYAGGRVQTVARDQDDLGLTYTLRHLSPADLEQLKAWRGQIVLLRTAEGERVYCTYLALSYRRLLNTTPADDSADHTFDADIAFTRVSYDESV